MKKTLLKILGIGLFIGACSVPHIPRTSHNFLLKQGDYIYLTTPDGFKVETNNESSTMLSIEYFRGSCIFKTKEKKGIDIRCNKELDLVIPYPESNFEWFKASTEYNKHYRAMQIEKLKENWEKQDPPNQ